MVELVVVAAMAAILVIGGLALGGIVQFPKLGGYGGYAFDVVLAFLAAAGWKRAFEAEQHAEKIKQFYEALPKQWVRAGAKRAGFGSFETLQRSPGQ